MQAETVILPLLAYIIFVCLLLVRQHGGKYMEEDEVKDFKTPSYVEKLPEWISVYFFFPCWLGDKIREMAFINYPCKQVHNFTQMRNPNKSEKWMDCLVS